jgi:sugar phosphate permease
LDSVCIEDSSRSKWRRIRIKSGNFFKFKKKSKKNSLDCDWLMSENEDPAMILSELQVESVVDEAMMPILEDNDKHDSEPEYDLNPPSKTWLILIFSSCYCTNLFILFGKGSFSVATTAMVAEKLLNKEQVGIIFGIGAITYTLGNYFWGFPVDYFGSRKTFLFIAIMMMFCLIANVIYLNSWVVAISFAIYCFFNSGNWPSLAKLIKNWMTGSQYASIYGVLSTSSQMGRVLSLLILGLLSSAGMHYRWTFLIGATLLGIIFVVNIFFLKSSPEDIGTTKPKDSVEIHTTHHEVDDKNLGSALLYFSKSLSVWLAMTFGFFSGISMEIFYFLSMFLVDTKGLSPGNASAFTATFSFGCAISVLLNGFIYGRLSKRWRLIVYTLQLLIGTIATFLLLLHQKLHIIILILLILIIGMCYSPSHYIPIGVFVSNFGGKYTGTLFTLVEGPGLIGSILIDIIGGIIAERFGWDVFLLVYSINSVLLTVTTFLFLLKLCWDT